MSIFSPLGGSDPTCCECLQVMTDREAIVDALYLGPGQYLCPRCQHPGPVLVREQAPE